MILSGNSPEGGWYRVGDQTFRWTKDADGADRRRAHAEAKKAAAGAPRPSYAEREAMRQAERNAQREAKFLSDLAEKGAAADAPPVNQARLRQRECERSYKPEERAKARHFERMADQWDEANGARVQAEEKAAAVAADPMLRTARDWVANWGIVVPPEFLVEVAAVKAFANATEDGPAAWEKIDELQARIRETEDRAVARKMVDAGASRSAFVDAANEAVKRDEAFKAAKPKPEPTRGEAGRFRGEPLPAADSIREVAQ